MAAIKKVQRSYYLPPDLVKWLKVQAAREGRTASDIVVSALQTVQNGKKEHHYE